MCLGIPAKIISLSDANKLMAVVDLAGVQREVNISCIVNESHAPEDCVGDWVLVHVGFAMSRIDEKEAKITLDILRELGEVQDALREIKETDTPT